MTKSDKTLVNEVTTSMDKKAGILLILLLGIGPVIGRGFIEPALYQSHYLWVLIYDLVKYTLPILLLYLGVRLSLFSSDEIGLTKTVRGFPWPYKATLFVVSYTLAVFVVHMIITRVTKGMFDSNILAVSFGKHPDIPHLGIRIFLAITFALLAAFYEECYFRGLMSKLLLDKGVSAYVILSSLVFAIAHWSGGIYSLVPTFFFGLIHAYYFVRLGSLVPAISAHFFNNAIIRFVAVMASSS